MNPLSQKTRITPARVERALLPAAFDLDSDLDLVWKQATRPLPLTLILLSILPSLWVAQRFSAAIKAFFDCAFRR
jgi:hypothetical protein